MQVLNKACTQPQTSSYNNQSAFVLTSDTCPSNFLEQFWSHAIGVAEAYDEDFRESKLPLARIKRVMKTEADVKMISSEVPILFAKACEVFISELTSRAFMVSTAANRRTLHRADVLAAIAKSDMFDFLIDIVPVSIFTPQVQCQILT